MNGIVPTAQAANIAQVAQMDFLVKLLQSTYSISLSFLKEVALVGRNDEFGQLKYKLNLDEDLVALFYKTVREDKQLPKLLRALNNQEEGEEEKECIDEDLDALACLFRGAIANFKDRIEDYVMEENNLNNLGIHYEVQIPNALRGLLIFLLNDALDKEAFVADFLTLTGQLNLLLESFKEAGVYFERYLIQLSKENFLKIIKRFHLAIS
jgi:hypothetical protein